MVDDKLAVPQALEKHFAIHGVRAEEIREHMGHKVYLAEGGPHHDANYWRLEDPDKWMAKGYYIAVWGVMVGKAVWGRPAYFEINHNSELTRENAKYARLNAAMADAQDYIETGVRGGLLERRSLIHLPPLVGV